MTKERLLAIGDQYEAEIAAARAADSPLPLGRRKAPGYDSDPLADSTYLIPDWTKTWASKSFSSMSWRRR
jgi:hypothetical protein